ncbi:MAG: NAD(P)H-dependent oxidoreductase [Clostridia bacterium]|nr:NAD(P)H-dependent oxidoreductase [Clostridia bacterium]
MAEAPQRGRAGKKEQTTLFINACVRRNSRTKRLADDLLAKYEGPVTEIRLGEIRFAPTDEAYLRRRDRLLAEKKFTDPMFAQAVCFAAADRIVIAAPYWDLSFPAALKQYLEQINVPGVTFFYTPQGVPQGLCRAKELIYVSTAGGTYVPDTFGFGYVKALAQNFYGIENVRLVQAVGLDLDGADPERILRESIQTT